jgi:ABC-2 type transport system permease protein/sodium transport system permease protein
MAAPVSTTDLVVGKFLVVTLIGLMSAMLNLLSVGGTIYLGGLGSLLSRGEDFVFPIAALPWVFLLLVPLAVMFGAVLLAVCSFARSFKEAQNYVAPVMVAAMIPGIVGILPGSRLEGPIVVMPVANIVVLTRDLFMGDFDYAAILIVVLSTSLYAAAAIAIAAKLFGQEAVLFADSGSIKTIFQRRFFKPRRAPSAAVALLVLAIVYSLNFYLQNGLARAGITQGVGFLASIALILGILFGLGPWLTTIYMRANPTDTFKLRMPAPIAWVAALCFGLSTWILTPLWLQWQSTWMPMDPTVEAQLEAQLSWIKAANPWMLVFFLALVPALCEELFFRGFVLSGVRTVLRKPSSIVLVALAFGLSHYMASRLAGTFLLGLVLAVLVVQFRSILPAMLLHFMHNAISTVAAHPRGIAPVLAKWGYSAFGEGAPWQWIAGASALALAGIALCIFAAPQEQESETADPSAPDPNLLARADG